VVTLANLEFIRINKENFRECRIVEKKITNVYNFKDTLFISLSRVYIYPQGALSRVYIYPQGAL